MKRLWLLGLLLVGPALARDRPGGLLERLQARRHSAQSGESRLIAGVKTTVWAPKGEGRLPLIVFSHGFHGSSRQSTFLMQALADHGYWVVAPNHGDAMGFSGRPQQPFGQAAKWSDATYEDRAVDIEKVLQGMETDGQLAGRIDWSRVGLAGHSLGGYTVLGMAGAWPSWKTSKIKAVLALSPYCQPYIDHERLGELGVPVMYQGGTLDMGITPTLKKPAGAYEQTSSPAYFVEFSGAGHFAFTDLQPLAQENITYYALAFFDEYVKGVKSEALSKRAGVSDFRSK